MLFTISVKINGLCIRRNSKFETGLKINTIVDSTQQQRLYQVGLTMLPMVGSVLAKNLLAYCGSAEQVFKTPKGKLEKIPMIGPERAKAIAEAAVLKDAEAEVKFMEDYKISPLFFTDESYPQRLKDCVDAPLLLYYKGKANLNATRIVAVVGTRRVTEYGKDITKKLIEALSGNGILVVSGLAYGVDAIAHAAALEAGLETIGVLGHGLNTIYPGQNKPLAKRMVEQGGLLTEYKSTDEMSPHNFPNRNRIVAGMSDATVIVESAVDGGALLTATIAHSYNRDVFAYPGRVNDKFSAGCNALIKSNKATLIESADDLLLAMNWHATADAEKNKPKQRQLALNLSEEERVVYDYLNTKGEVDIDALTVHCEVHSGSLAVVLLEMEMNGLLVALPGKRYKLL